MTWETTDFRGALRPAVLKDWKGQMVSQGGAGFKSETPENANYINYNNALRRIGIETLGQ